MTTNYSKESSWEFQEVDQKQSHDSGQPTKQYISCKVVNESELQFNRQPLKQRITAWSSSSSESSSSLSTGSLFSLTDSSLSKQRYKTTGTLFGNLDLVSHDPRVDPAPFACYNCWHFDHEFLDCHDLKIYKYCRNCGRRGVIMNNCPRCARAYLDYLDQSYKHYDGYLNKMKDEESHSEMHLHVIKEGYEECWDGYVEDDYVNAQTSYLNLQKKEVGYQGEDWDDYQNPRKNLVQKSTDLFSLNATKAEVAKCKVDIWSDFEVHRCSNSWEQNNGKMKNASFIISEEREEYKVEDWNDYEQENCQDIFPSLDENNNQLNLENEKAEHESDCWSNHDKNYEQGVENLIVSDDKKVENEVESWDDSNDRGFGNFEEIPTAVFQSAHLIYDGKTSVKDQNNNDNSWTDINENASQNPEISFVIEFKTPNLNTHFDQMQQEREDWHDLDAESYQSFEDSFYEQELETEAFADEEYWTDFDDDYRSLQASFAEEYKSLNSTADDENDFFSVLETDDLDFEGKSVFYDSHSLTENAESKELFSYIIDEKANDSFAFEQSYDGNIHRLNSIESSVCSQSDAYLSQEEDADDYDTMIVDENERSELFPFAGQAVRDFLDLLDSVKHLPIKIQNLAVHHFICKQKEQFWQMQQM